MTVTTSSVAELTGALVVLLLGAVVLGSGRSTRAPGSRTLVREVEPHDDVADHAARQSGPMAVDREPLADERPSVGMDGVSVQVRSEGPPRVPAGKVDTKSPSSHGADVTFLGQPCIITWSGDERIVTYKDGGLFSRGRFSRGRRVGLHQGWHKNGGLRNAERYSADGKAHGRFESYDQTGAPQRIGHYENGIKCGNWSEFYDSGALEWHGPMVNGLNHGVWTYYDWETGAVDPKRSGTYVEGERVGD